MNGRWRGTSHVRRCCLPWIVVFAMLPAACGVSTSTGRPTGSDSAPGSNPHGPAASPATDGSANVSAGPSAQLTPLPDGSMAVPGTTPDPSRSFDPNWEGTSVAFDPANFVDPTLDTNPFHPLKPGLQWVRAGTTEVGSRVVPHEIITTMTDVIRVIDGVPTIAMLDESTDSGEVSQVGMDYLALDKSGNVWILGGYTEDYQGGSYVNLDNAYLGSETGGQLGILAPAHVDAMTPRWLIGKAPDEKASVGTPVEVGGTYCVEFGCFNDVRVVQEGNVGAPDNENKYYAPGVGVINNVPLDASLHQDTFQLVNFLALSPAGLAEASRTVLDLEAHARQVAPDVFGAAPKSKRHR